VWEITETKIANKTDVAIDKVDTHHILPFHISANKREFTIIMLIRQV
jgi:hypothetical protein